jgi:hypothetical protein
MYYIIHIIQYIIIYMIIHNNVCISTTRTRLIIHTRTIYICLHLFFIFDHLHLYWRPAEVYSVSVSVSVVWSEDEVVKYFFSCGCGEHDTHKTELSRQPALRPWFLEHDTWTWFKPEVPCRRLMAGLEDEKITAITDTYIYLQITKGKAG